jgi:1,4-dihydroxy-2-naphthoyl-CoA hydrolase
MSFNYEYTIQFRDTDAAGVVYFTNIISICHVAYEASLIESGIDLKSFVGNPEFAVPISHVSADFFEPLFCGDRVIIQLTPILVNSPLVNSKFEINYQILSADSASIIYADVKTRHITINTQTRKQRELPKVLSSWLLHWI